MQNNKIYHRCSSPLFLLSLTYSFVSFVRLLKILCGKLRILLFDKSLTSIIRVYFNLEIKVISIIIYIQKLLDSDWLKTSAFFV